MNVTKTAIDGCLIIEPKVHGDERGFFLELYRRDKYSEVGIHSVFVQDNHSRSCRNTLRGLHYQVEQPQGKLVWATRGEIVDVVVDIRQSSPTFGKVVMVPLVGDSHRQLWVPPGLAHGFCVLSESADVVYKCTAVYAPQHERTLLWNDPDLAIDWPVKNPILSAKDQQGKLFKEAEKFA